MRIGIFGGTFDPVHVGHLILAEQCRDQGRLDEVWFVPAAAPPHKLAGELTPFERRVEMLALATAGHPSFRINELEKDRAGPSYTAHTLEELRRRHAGAELCLVIGSDSLNDLPGWYQPARVVELARLLVWVRPSHPPLTAEQLRGALHLPPQAPLHLQIVEGPVFDISSTYLRRQAATGGSIRYLVPRAVECYIEAHRLYREED
jgi:nicotinate-nucleotide adenylyltransferase